MSWRELAEWDWVDLHQDDDPDHRLHAVAEITNDPDKEWRAEGTTACGIVTDDMWIPGMFSRMGCDRCPACCEATGMPPGKGSPKNDDACRPIAEARFAAIAGESREQDH